VPARPRSSALLVVLVLLVAAFVALWAASHLTVAGQRADAGAFRTLAPLHDAGRDLAGALRRGLPVACAAVVAVLGVVALVRRAWRDLLAAVVVVLVDPQDTQALATAVLGLLDDPERAQRIGAAGRRRVEDFTWERVVDRYEDLYAGLAEVRPRGRRPGEAGASRR